MFWRQTPRTFSLTIEARARAMAAAQDRETAQAWLTAALHRAKKMPKLAALLKKTAQPKAAAKARPWHKQMNAWARYTKVEVKG